MVTNITLWPALPKVRIMCKDVPLLLDPAELLAKFSVIKAVFRLETGSSPSDKVKIIISYLIIAYLLSKCVYIKNIFILMTWLACDPIPIVFCVICNGPCYTEWSCTCQ